VYHPGDSFTVPEAPVPVLLVPTNAPWSKLSEVIDFAVAVRAPRAYPVHDSLVKDSYLQLAEGNLKRIAAPYGVDYEHLTPVQTVSV
jgi:hypothetical protein